MKRIRKLVTALVCMFVLLANVSVFACEQQDSVYGRLPQSLPGTYWQLVRTANQTSSTTFDKAESIQGTFKVESSTTLKLEGTLYNVIDLGVSGTFTVGAEVTLKIERNRYDHWNEYDEYYNDVVSGASYVVGSASRHCKVWSGHSYAPWRLGAM